MSEKYYYKFSTRGLTSRPTRDIISLIDILTL